MNLQSTRMAATPTAAFTTSPLTTTTLPVGSKENPANLLPANAASDADSNTISTSGQLKPSLFTPSLVGNFNEGQTGLPNDLDGKIFSAIPLPTLVKVSRLSRGCHAALQLHLRRHENANGQGNLLRRERYAAQQARQVKHLQSQKLADGFENQVKIQGTAEQFVSRVFDNRKVEEFNEWLSVNKGESIYLPLHLLDAERWPPSVSLASADGQWRDLTLEFSTLLAGQFGKFALPTLAAVQASVHANSRQHLVLGADFSMADVEALLAWLRASPACCSLAFSATPKDVRALEKLLKGLPDTMIDTLNFDFRITADLQEMFMPMLENSRLRHLSIQQASHDDAGAALLAGAMCRNTGLLSLSVNHTAVTKVGASFLSQAIAQHPTLERVAYANGNLGQQAWQTMGQSLAANMNVTEIILKGCMSDDGSQTAVLKALASRNNLVHLDLAFLLVDARVLPWLEKIVSNNPMLCQLNGCVLISSQQAQLFSTIVKKVNGPLTLHITGSTQCKDILHAAAKENLFLSIQAA